MTYKSAEQRQDEEKLSALILQYAPDVPMQGPLCLHLIAHMPIPASKSGKWKSRAMAGQEMPTGKADVSNILKNIEDVMHCPFFADDKQIVQVWAEKRYGDPARYEIELRQAHTEPF
jgi:Holliday junction resolvase RusA-like endonuclease